jgi:hypothetical protein
VPVFAALVKSRWWDLNPQPRLYESRALPLSYIGKPVVILTAIGGSVKGSAGQKSRSTRRPGQLRCLIGPEHLSLNPPKPSVLHT